MDARLVRSRVLGHRVLRRYPVHAGKLRLQSCGRDPSRLPRGSPCKCGPPHVRAFIRTETVWLPWGAAPAEAPEPRQVRGHRQPDHRWRRADDHACHRRRSASSVLHHPCIEQRNRPVKETLHSPRHERALPQARSRLSDVRPATGLNSSWPVEAERSLVVMLRHQGDGLAPAERAASRTYVSESRCDS